MNILLIDNYDSFTYNLVQLFRSCDCKVAILRNDVVSSKSIREMNPEALVISPGPKTPQKAGRSKQIIRTFRNEIPMLGVCLGMQAINEVHGGITRRAPIPMHGKRSQIRHSEDVLFRGIPELFCATRYHSLCVEIRTNDIVPIAWSADGVVMALRHRTLPMFGVQFHPESFLTEFGKEIAINFLQIVNDWNGVCE